MTCKVSVIIPVYNRPDDVQRAVASVLAQTVQDFEIILVDDCSTDDATLRSATACVQQHPDKIRLLRHTRNRGVSAARNTGIAGAEGEYVAFLDSDDEWLPRKLEGQLALIEKHSAPATLLCLCALDVVEKETGFRTGTYRFAGDGEFPLRLLELEILNPCSVMLLSRTHFNTVGPFDETMHVAEDIDWLLRHIIAGGSVVSTANALSIYKSELGKLYQDSEETLNRVLKRYGILIWKQFGFRAYRHFVSGIHYHQFRGARRRNRFFSLLYHFLMIGVSPARLSEKCCTFISEKLHNTSIWFRLPPVASYRKRSLE